MKEHDMSDFEEKQKSDCDVVQSFQLDRSLLRGRFVRLGPVLDQILGQHDYPFSVAKVLAEVTVVSVALGSALKHDGVFTLQTKSDGPVRLLVSDMTSDGGVRAYAAFDAAKLSECDHGDPVGKGHLAFTVDLGSSGERYQGIVELDAKGVVDAVQRYFHQSEQIPTGLIAFVRRSDDGHWQAGCLMLQRMPREGGIAAASDTSVEDDWFRAMSLMQTCTEAELTDPALPIETLLYRLFHEEEIRVYEPLPLRHQCRCSRERVADLLASMSDKERKDMIEDGRITMTCAFCSKSYAFTEEEAEELTSRGGAS
jgi:molecular chaperone Hsp33